METDLANRLKIGKCNLRLSSDVTLKEATLQVVYDVLKLTPFYKAFQDLTDVPEIYMQEFMPLLIIKRSVRFKMNNKKHILNLDQFRDILQIFPKVGNKKFEEPPLEKEILAFLASLGHSGEIRKITDVNVNKLHQPWRSFAAIINKCLSGKTSYDSLRLSQAQILWGMYKNKKVDYAYLLNQVNMALCHRMPQCFTDKSMIHSRNEDTPVCNGTILPAELTNEDIRNSYHTKSIIKFASENIPPKTKSSKNKVDSYEATTKQKPPHPQEKERQKTRKRKAEWLNEGVDMKEKESDEECYIYDCSAPATSLVDIPVTAIAEPSFFAPTNRPPTPTPLFTQLQQPPILTPATTPSSTLLNLPNFGSLFGFDNRLKALEDNFSEFKQTNQYAEALSSIPGIVDQYLENKMKEAVDVAVQLKSDRIREEAQAENQQFLDSIDEGMKKVIKEQVKSEVSKITPQIEKLVNEQLESEVLVRSSKEAKTSHAVAANLSELELKKILIDKMELKRILIEKDLN
ncbi:hypothetical protein Tco_0833633 [Tanacetum coccineum]